MVRSQSQLLNTNKCYRSLQKQGVFATNEVRTHPKELLKLTQRRCSRFILIWTCLISWHETCRCCGVAPSKSKKQCTDTDVANSVGKNHNLHTRCAQPISIHIKGECFFCSRYLFCHYCSFFLVDHFDTFLFWQWMSLGEPNLCKGLDERLFFVGGEYVFSLSILMEWLNYAFFTA